MSDEKKLHVDENWKEKVQQEKELSKTATAAGETAESAEATRAVDVNDPQLPPASISTLVTMLATQAMVALGQFPMPNGGKPVVRKNLARHYIDTLAVLEEKTQGRLTNEESELLSGSLHDLRMMFIHGK